LQSAIEGAPHIDFELPAHYRGERVYHTQEVHDESVLLDWNLNTSTMSQERTFMMIPTDDWLRLIEKVQKAGLKAKAEVGIQFRAGGATTAAELETEGTRDPESGDLSGEAFCRGQSTWL
jgi:hypothetical protein